MTGAGGLVGRPLAERCQSTGLDVIRAGRRNSGDGWLAWDMAAAPCNLDGRLDSVMHAAPLWLLPDHVEALAAMGVERIVCFSSTSVLTKRGSANPGERALAERLGRAERRTREASEAAGVATTVLRPTMIYGYGRDGNVTAIARFIRRYGFFAVAGTAGGRRQPVHANDLVDAAMAVLDEPGTGGRTYNLGGGEVLTYRTMVARIFNALHKPVRIVTVPTGLYQVMLGIAGIVNRNVTASMAARMNQDLVFDSTDARVDFGFSPQPFLNYPERDLPPR